MTVRAKHIDKVDRHASHEVNGARREWWMRAIGTVSDIGDQPQLRLLCAGVVTIGVFRTDGKLFRTGIRMYAAHSLATMAKSIFKAFVDRTRPDSEQDGYQVRIGNSEAHDQTSFPSGHSAGIVAVAEAFAHNYPAHATAARLAAGSVAVAQVARGKHYIGDITAGALIGLASNYAIDRIVPSKSSASPSTLDPLPPRDGASPHPDPVS